MDRCRWFVLLAVFGLVAVACGDGTQEATPTTTPATVDASTPSDAAPTPTTTAATTTTAAPPADRYTIEVATLNVLHGFPAASNCAPETDQCNAPTRARMIWQMLEDDAGCPEIIALQEIDARWFEIVPEILPDLCAGDHVLLTENVGSPDQEMILTTLPVIDEARTTLAGGPIWSAHWAQLDGGVRPDGSPLIVDVFATHFASSSLNLPCMDNPFDPCSPTCPPEMLMGDCHPIQALEFLADRAAPESIQLIVGDLNKQPHEERITRLLDAGFVDTHVLAGNPECPEEGGPTCTTGIGSGADTIYDGLDVRDTTPRGRIDFILARPPDGCELTVDGQDTDDADTDGDGTSTGVWASTPLAEPVDGLYWASDHAGIQADIGVVCTPTVPTGV